MGQQRVLALIPYEIHGRLRVKLSRHFRGLTYDYVAKRWRASPLISTQAHRHDHVEERSIDLEHARAQLIDQFKINLVGVQRVQRLDDIAGVKRYRYVLAL